MGGSNCQSPAPNPSFLHVCRVVVGTGAGESVHGGGELAVVAAVAGVDAAGAEADGDASEQLAVVEAANPSGGRLVEEVLSGRRRMRAGPVDVSGRIDNLKESASNRNRLEGAGGPGKGSTKGPPAPSPSM